MSIYCVKVNIHFVKKVLFIGTYLSNKRGTKPISEKLKEVIGEEFNIRLKSRIENKVLRILDICLATLFSRYTKIHFDVFSGPAFWITQIASQLASFRDKYIILTLRGGKLVEFSEPNRSRVEKVLKRASHIQTPSCFLQEYFMKLGFDVHYLPNGVDVSKFSYNRNEVMSHSLLWVRAFSSIYNPELAVRVLHEVRKKYPETILTMIGPDHGILEQTTRLINQLSLTEAVKIIGPVQNDQLQKYYQTHSAYLNTTTYESFGVAIVEAASCGIPVVSFNVGEIPFLWKDEETILLAPLLDVDTMALQVNRIFNDESLATKLSIEARKRAEQFSWDAILPHWLEVLNR